MFDFTSEKTTWLLNPRLPDDQKQALNSHTNAFPGHFCLTTSGSVQLKWVALSHKALLTSAKAVNLHLESDQKDVWVNPLPSFHVGGLAIYARSFLSGAEVVPLENWDPASYSTCLERSHATLTSLVPTQLFDLVLQHLSPPPTLRAAVVGGGPLATELYQKAKALGWPILTSYGMTEAASQVATASLMSPKLQILPHVQLSIRGERICLKSDALLTAYGLPHRGEIQWEDPKKEGWLETEDRAVLKQGQLHLKGRASQCIKISGEMVHLQRLETTLQAVKLELGITAPAYLLASPHPRTGHQIELISTQELPSLVDAFNLRVLPVERIRHIRKVPKINIK